MLYITKEGDGSVILKIFVQPKAKRTAVVGKHGGTLKLSVAAPPVEGKANKEVVKYLAKLFGLKKKEVTIVSGEKSRYKSCLLATLSEEEVRGVLTPLVS